MGDFPDDPRDRALVALALATTRSPAFKRSFETLAAQFLREEGRLRDSDRRIIQELMRESTGRPAHRTQDALAKELGLDPTERPHGVATVAPELERADPLAIQVRRARLSLLEVVYIRPGHGVALKPLRVVATSADASVTLSPASERLACAFAEFRVVSLEVFREHVAAQMVKRRALTAAMSKLQEEYSGAFDVRLAIRPIRGVGYELVDLPFELPISQ